MSDIQEIIKMNENKGFILTPEMYHKKEWCKMYHMVIKEYRVLQRRIEKAQQYIKENEFYLDYKTGACIKNVIPLLNILEGNDNNE